LFEHKYLKIWQIPSHTSKVVPNNNIEILIPWFCRIQNGLQPKHRA
jgi:hypothetical protein